MEKKPEAISFKPINPGLGFHPFSDGLPYSPPPMKKIQKSPAPRMGTGAVMAGPPRVAIPSQPSKTLWAADTTKPKAPAPEPQNAAEVNLSFGYAFKRALAYLIDCTFNVVLCGGAMGLVMSNLNMPFGQLLAREILISAIFFLFAINWALIAAQEIAFNTSLGKHLLGLTLEGGFGAVFIRSLFFIPSFALAGAGIWIALFDSKKRCAHDRLSGIQPVEITRF